VTPLRFRWRAAVLNEESGLSMAARLAACVYAEHATNESAVLDPAPGAARLARCMGASETTGHRARRELEAEGWLCVTRRRGRPSRMLLVLPDPCLSDGGTPVTTPVKTPVDLTPEPGEQGEPGEQVHRSRANALAESPGKGRRNSGPRGVTDEELAAMVRRKEAEEEVRE
jgi:hypothetical protein